MMSRDTLLSIVVVAEGTGTFGSMAQVATAALLGILLKLSDT